MTRHYLFGAARAIAISSVLCPVLYSNELHACALHVSTCLLCMDKFGNRGPDPVAAEGLICD